MAYRSLALAIALLAVAPCAVGQSGEAPFIYTSGSFSHFYFPGTGTLTTPTGINESGQIVGYYRAAQGQPSQGFFYSDGAFSTINYPGAMWTVARGISNNGNIVGYDGSHAGFFYAAGNFTMIMGYAYGVNDAGEVVGATFDRTNGLPQGYLYTSGVYTSIGYPGATYTEPFDINDRGQITGRYGNCVNGLCDVHGFLYSAGVYISIDYPGALLTASFGVNDGGQLAGYYLTGQAGAWQYLGFTYLDGAFTMISDPTSTSTVNTENGNWKPGPPYSTFVYGINDIGQLVGGYEGQEPAQAAEPSYIALLVPSLAAWIAAKRKHKSN